MMLLISALWSMSYFRIDERGMPLDTGLLYGEMLASAIGHAAMPMLIVLIINTFPYMEASYKSLTFIGLFIVLSFLIQMGFLSVLQINTCSGMSNFVDVVKGALVAAIITGVMIVIPVFVEPMRIMISKYFITHHTQMTDQMRKRAEIVATAASGLQNTYIDPTPSAPPAELFQKGGASGISVEEYENQTLQEISAGSSYWAAFAGAYGVAFGSLIASTCPPPE